MAITITDKFKKLSAKMGEVSKDASIFQKLEHRLFSAERIAQKRREINARVVARMMPAIRGALSQAYRASGLGDGDGHLRSAAVNANIRATEHGIIIEFPDDAMAAQAGALQYGAVRRGKNTTTAYQGYDFFNIRSLDIESIYLKYYQEEIDKEMANG